LLPSECKQAAKQRVVHLKKYPKMLSKFMLALNES